MRLAMSVCFVLLFLIGSTNAQQGPPKMSKADRDEVLHMLNSISADVKKHYYDSKFHGVDWDASVKSYEQKIENAASLNWGLSEVAAALDTLNDSHTFFLPPPRPYIHSYGWRTAMIGDKCFILGVRPDTDADQKGLRPGDQILNVGGLTPDRDNLWKIDFIFNLLRPQPALRLSLLSPDGQQKNVEVKAAVRQTQKVTDLTGQGIWNLVREIESQSHEFRIRWLDTPDGVMVLKFPAFLYSESEVYDIMKKARDHQALIVDLRGNGGGSVETLRAFVSNFFDHDVKIADRVMRDNTKPVLARSGGKNAFSGKLIVLIDNRSGSASEVLARVVQLEKRGTVLGDRSAGAVMEAKRYQYRIGYGTMILYGASITEADLVMTDGKSLEGVGVTPDELLLPTADDLAAGRDPVLARAVRIAGGAMTPEAAGKLFPYEWPRN
jgi:C-terminal processing protease CtpA/Prc